MAGGPAFLRPVTELTTRLCYVHFDGKSALQASRKIGLEEPLPKSFVQEYCTPVYVGIQVFTTYYVRHKTTIILLKYILQCGAVVNAW